MNYMFHEMRAVLGEVRNWKRLPNAALTLTSYLLTRIFGSPVVLGYPFMMMIEPTNICNLRCPLCITGSKLMTRENGMMDVRLFQKLIDEVSPYVMHLTLWSQGEPFVNRDFCKMVAYASSKGMKTVTSTNGHFLKENADDIVRSGLGTLIIAMDGVSQETYEKYRVNGKFNKVYDGLQAVAAAKRTHGSQTPEIELQFIVMKHNEHEIDDVRTLATECGVQVVSFKTAQVYTAEQAREFLPSTQRFRRYEFDEHGEVKTRISERNFCRWVMLCPVLNWDGTVSPCCFDKNADYPLGNVFRDGGLKRIWKGPPYRDFRKRILSERKKIPICTNCSEGLKVEVFEKERVPQQTRPLAAERRDEEKVTEEIESW